MVTVLSLCRYIAAAAAFASVAAAMAINKLNHGRYLRCVYHAITIDVAVIIAVAVSIDRFVYGSGETNRWIGDGVALLLPLLLTLLLP